MYLAGRPGCFQAANRTRQEVPGIIAECAAAMEAIVPWNRVHKQLTPKNYVEVHAYSKSWPCLFPQHGAGKKHERKIELTDWQEELVDLVPMLLIRGLIHSDGCRFINTGRGGWSAPRYVFTNFSEDIKGIFCQACDRLDLNWTTAPPKSIYISRQGRRRAARRVRRAEALRLLTRAGGRGPASRPGPRWRRSRRRRLARACSADRGPCPRSGAGGRRGWRGP
jgi:hypothetical protein